jgi:hypothetical protein
MTFFSTSEAVEENCNRILEIYGGSQKEIGTEEIILYPQFAGELVCALDPYLSNLLGSLPGQLVQQRYSKKFFLKGLESCFSALRAYSQVIPLVWQILVAPLTFLELPYPLAFASTFRLLDHTHHRVD